MKPFIDNITVLRRRLMLRRLLRERNPYLQARLAIRLIRL